MLEKVSQFCQYIQAMLHANGYIYPTEVSTSYDFAIVWKFLFDELSICSEKNAFTTIDGIIFELSFYDNYVIIQTRKKLAVEYKRLDLSGDVMSSNIVEELSKVLCKYGLLVETDGLKYNSKVKGSMRNHIFVKLPIEKIFQGK